MDEISRRSLFRLGAGAAGAVVVGAALPTPAEPKMQSVTFTYVTDEMPEPEEVTYEWSADAMPRVTRGPNGLFPTK